MVKSPRAFVISTGTEITQGLYADTNAMHLSRILRDHGFEVVGHAAAPDDAGRIRDAIRGTFGVADLVIVTGGLGPTEDDLNREIVARLWEVPLVRVHRAEEMIRERFRSRGVSMPERNLGQADIPEGAKTLLNFWGTAPGFAMPGTGGRPMLLAMPGVPAEWRAMMDRYFRRVVLPMFPNRPVSRIHTIHLSLVPESTVNGWIRDLFDSMEGVRLGILASRGIIRVRIAASGDTDAVRDRRMEAMRGCLRDRLPTEFVLAEGPESTTPEDVVIETCLERRLTIATAESCTGGGIARRLTNVSGSSGVLLEGFVTYGNGAKTRTLGVDGELLERHGAVSGECAAAMATGARERTGANVALSVTGIAGPGGGSKEKPVGTVWFAIASEEGVQTILRAFPGSRSDVREWSENQALDMLRRYARGLPTVPTG